MAGIRSRGDPGTGVECFMRRVEMKNSVAFPASTSLACSRLPAEQYLASAVYIAGIAPTVATVCSIMGFSCWTSTATLFSSVATMTWRS